VSTAGVLERIHARLPPGWQFEQSPMVERLYSFVIGAGEARPGVRHLSLLYGDLQNLARTGSGDELLEAFESDVNVYIAQATRRWFFVHAGVVAWKGRAIVIPGRSFSGKTVLVKEFLRAGATYYSDEFAVFDECGQVHPFPRSLAIRQGEPPTRTRVPAEDLGSQTGVQPLPVGTVLLTRYRAGARWRPRTLSWGKGTLGLLANSLSARSRPKLTMATLGKAVCRARILSGTRGEASETVDFVLRQLAS
jgi:hypothetical protein